MIENLIINLKMLTVVLTCIRLEEMGREVSAPTNQPPIFS